MIGSRITFENLKVQTKPIIGCIVDKIKIPVYNTMHSITNATAYVVSGEDNKSYVVRPEQILSVAPKGT